MLGGPHCSMQQVEEYTKPGVSTWIPAQGGMVPPAASFQLSADTSAAESPRGCQSDAKLQG